MAQQFEDKVTILNQAGEVVIVLSAKDASITASRKLRKTVIDENLVFVGVEPTPSPISNEIYAIPHAILRVGDNSLPGYLAVSDENGKPVLTVDGSRKNPLQLKIFDDKGEAALQFEPRRAALKIGVKGGNEGDLQILNGDGAVVIHLDGQTGDIKLKGADCAEAFPALHSSDLDAGTVCIIGTDGSLESCSAEYDRRAAGIVA